MMAETTIEWADYTFNPWIGCTKVSPACANCYAERDFDHRYSMAKWGPNGTRVLTSYANWRKPLAWDKAAAESSTRPRVFCASLADVFEDWRGPILSNGTIMGKDYRASGGNRLTMGDVRQRLFDLIDATPNLDWLLLTKRPENIKRMINCIHLDGGTTGRIRELDIDTPAHIYFRRNVWLGTSVEDQKWADLRIPELLKCRELSPVLFLSCEPVVGPIDFNVGIRDYLDGLRVYQMPTLPKNYLDRIDWVIAGGESGPDARPSHPDWFRSLRDQCEATNTPFLFKQWGEWASVSEVAGTGKHFTFSDGATVRRVGKKAAGRFFDGRLHDGFPQRSVV